MEKTNRFVGYFFLMMFIAAFVSCDSTSSKEESTGEYVDDSVITTKVKSLFSADDFLKSFQISVETHKGTVQLSGFVDSKKAADKAVEIAQSVKWVKSVKNDLIVKTSKEESTGEYIDDTVITATVKSLLGADDFLKSFQIGVETYKGTVQLSGFVNSKKAVDKAVEIAGGVKGVKSVKNDLIVK